MLGFSALKILLLGVILVAVWFIFSLGRAQGRRQGWSMAESFRNMRNKAADMSPMPPKTTQLEQCPKCKAFHDRRTPCDCLTSGK